MHFIPPEIRRPLCVYLLLASCVHMHGESFFTTAVHVEGRERHSCLHLGRGIGRENTIR